jgi:hypothetical protein
MASSSNQAIGAANAAPRSAFTRRLPWALFTRNGIPPLVLTRPVMELPAGTILNVDPADKRQVMRARHLYEMRRADVAPPDSKAKDGAKERKPKNGTH